MVSVKPLASFLTTGELLSLLQIHFLLLCTNQHPSIRKCRRGAPEPNSGLTRSRRRQLWRKPRPAASATTSPQHGCVCVTHLIEGHRTQSLIFPGKKKTKQVPTFFFYISPCHLQYSSGYTPSPLEAHSFLKSQEMMTIKYNHFGNDLLFLLFTFLSE